MSKASEQPSWDAREAFHRATMAVYADLGALVAILKKEPDLQAALLALDSIPEHRAPERGDSELIASMKHAVGHLLESLNAAIDVRQKYPGVGSAFGGGRGIDRTWGAIASASHHEVALAAAEAVLEPATAGSGTAVIRHEVIQAVADREAWGRLAENLKHEHKSASVLPQGDLPQANMTGEAREAITAYVHDIAERWLRATWFATGGGLRSTAASSRSTLSELTDRLLRLAAKMGQPCSALQEVDRVLVDIDASDAWIDGPTWQARAMCRACGSIKFERSGRCSNEPGGCDGEIEVLGEDAWVHEAKFHRDRLMRRLAAALERARMEVQQLCSPDVGASATAPGPVPLTADLTADNKTHGAPPATTTTTGPESLGFTKVEKAIALLMRDGGQRKSVREYAKLVGVSHSTLSRSEQWRKAWAASATNPAELPMGTKDAEGRLEAWREIEFCDNCHQEPITGTATVGGELVRVCETCARKLAPRTNPRTTRRT
jgi:hypothetical protein